MIFDVPESRRFTRDKLRKHLHGHGFGYLQNSVWVTPDPVSEQRALLAGGAVDVESLILLEARPCAGEKDAEIVAGAWDLAEINRRYAVHRQVLTRRPRVRLGSKAAAAMFHRWLREERVVWLDAIELQVDRNDGKGNVLLTIDTTPGYTDTQPFPATKTAWTYRAIYQVNDARVGVWSQVVSVAVPA